jgi:transposase
VSSQVEQYKEKDRIDWRRDKIQELSSQGQSQREIAGILQIGLTTVNRDISYPRQQSTQNIKKNTLTSDLQSMKNVL